MLKFAKIENNLVVDIILVKDETQTPNSNTYISVTDDLVSTGYSYDSNSQIFIPPKPPYNSWVFNYETKNWESPVPKPSDFNSEPYVWNEANTSWDIYNFSLNNILNIKQSDVTHNLTTQNLTIEILSSEQISQIKETIYDTSNTSNTLQIVTPDPTFISIGNSIPVHKVTFL